MEVSQAAIEVSPGLRPHRRLEVFAQVKGLWAWSISLQVWNSGWFAPSRPIGEKISDLFSGARLIKLDPSRYDKLTFDDVKVSWLGTLITAPKIPSLLPFSVAKSLECHSAHSQILPSLKGRWLHRACTPAGGNLEGHLRILPITRFID